MIKYAVLGIIQGLTEFLPVSSSGHLVVAQKLMGVSSPGITLEIIVHSATVIAVIIFLWKQVLTLFKFENNWKEWPLTHVIIGTIPAAILGLLFKDQIEAQFEHISGVRIFFIINSFILAMSIIRRPQRRLNIKVAFLIGVAQCLALLPGISRSGTTITAGLLLGLQPIEAFTFSFFLLLPAVGGALLLDLLKGMPGFMSQDIVAFLFALIFGIFALWLLKRTVIAKKLHLFGIYTFLLGLILFFV